jgi:N-acetylneuraminic acid mutarotase
MAQQALTAGEPTRRRALFGLLDANGWTWAGVKAFFWLIVIIFMLGYVPDRAYYFTVQKTLDLGVLIWSPINLCPPENETLPCPPPTGAILPWEPSPSELALPAGRTDGAAVQIGAKLLFVGGSDGATASAETFQADITGDGNFGPWAPAPPLPEPRADASTVFYGGSVYVIGGSDASGTATTTVFSLTPDPETGVFGEWTIEDSLALPAPRTGAAPAVAGDGIFLVGGEDGDGALQNSIWKSTVDARGSLQAWAPQANLYAPVAGAVAVHEGDYLWVVGGVTTTGEPTGLVQRGETQAAVEGAGGGGHGGTTTTTGATDIVRVGIKEGDINLPVARANATGLIANGVIYVIGGDDATGPKGEVYWAIPDANGELTWQTLEQTDLPAEGVSGGAGVVSGSTALVIGGETTGGVLASTARAYLAPQPPFFQLGILGMTIPALSITGEVGQQLGYLNAALVGTVNFVIIIAIGVAFAHRERTTALIRRIARRG